jgi:hypothetical protein
MGDDGQADHNARARNRYYLIMILTNDDVKARSESYLRQWADLSGGEGQALVL